MLLSTLCAGLPVVTEETELSAPLPPPHPEDLAAVTTTVEKRQVEYLAGRHCARAALAKLGIHDFVLRAGPDRGPLWPPGIVGSITHTGTPGDGFCGVVAARKENLIALGIDAEMARPLPAELWPMVLTPREHNVIENQSTERRGSISTLYFAAKESVYKALFPLFGRCIDFHDVELDLDLEAGRFSARMTAPGLPLSRIRGRLVLTTRLVLTAVVVRHAETV